MDQYSLGFMLSACLHHENCIKDTRPTIHSCCNPDGPTCTLSVSLRLIFSPVPVMTTALRMRQFVMRLSAGKGGSMQLLCQQGFPKLHHVHEQSTKRNKK